MSYTYTSDKEFKNQDYTVRPLPLGQYEDCRFLECNFNACDLSEYKFITCQFSHCDLSMCRIKKTILQKVDFDNCKMMGIRFDECDDFLLKMGFSSCILNYSSFYKMELSHTVLDECKMIEVDLAETNLSGAQMPHCDLSGAIFDGTNLTGADLSTAFNFYLDPDTNTLTQCRFSINNIKGLLSKYDIIIES